MSEQNLKTFEKALKECYLPVWQNQLGIEPSALLGKIKKVPLVGDKIVASAPIGLSGGFGFSQEGKATPDSGHVNFEKFVCNTKDMYVNVCISQKAVELATTGGAMANALDTEVKAAYETAKWNVGRSLFGNGTGKLTDVIASNGNVIKVADTKNLKEGLIVDFYVADATPGESSPALTRRIKSVDRLNKTITIDGEGANVAAGFITVQKSFGNEITGLGAIFDDSITTIYGVSKESNPYLKPIVHDAESAISDGIITKVLRESQREKGGNVDMLLMGDSAYDAYVDYLRTNNIRVEDKTGTIAGGFKSIKFIFGNREIDIVNEGFVPENETWGIDTSATEFHSKDWGFASLQGGGIFNLMENSSVYRALLYNYGEIICKNPGSCIRIKNCA